MSSYKTYDPPPSLRTLIRELQIYRVNWNEELDLPVPFITCLANTEQNLYFYVNDPVKLVVKENVEIAIPPVVVTGPKYKTSGLLFGRDHLMIKIAFQPTGTFRLLGVNMQQTVNAGIDAKAFWGTGVEGILTELRKISCHDSMIEIVVNFIEQRCEAFCRAEEPIDRVAIQMLNPVHDHSLDEWACLACLSVRQFERNFTNRVGISPKLFIRIVRFEQAMKVKNSVPGKSWAEIALECGYTDSSHLLKEFRVFAEFPPSHFYLQPTSGYSQFPTG